jgi:hypothetical protein
MASRTIAEWAVWSIVLAGTMLLQAQKKGGASHGAPAAHEHSAAPQKQEHTPLPCESTRVRRRSTRRPIRRGGLSATIRHKRHAFRIRPPLSPSSIRRPHIAAERLLSGRPGIL